MGESDRYYDYRRSRISLGSDNNALTILVSINAIFFITIGFIKIVYDLTQSAPGSFENHVLPLFILPAKLSSLGHRPWTILTYMFSQTSIIVTITSLLWLWVFGSILQGLSGNRKLIPIYLYGGLAGAVAFIAANYLMPPLKPYIDQASLQGASASIMAVAVATTALAPDYRFFKMLNGGIPIGILTLIYIIIDFAGTSGASAAFHIAHLAGALAGFLFVFSLRRGTDLSVWMNNLFDWFTNLFNPEKQSPPVRRRIKEKVFYKTGNQKPFVKRSNITQQRIDEILDKINQKGFHLLTDEEKNILKRAGESDL
jgi:membrane associated rhomboid family serine protease